jgi:3-dehydroquinate synthase
LGLCAPDEAERVRAHFDALNLPTDPGGLGFSTEALIRHMHHDKKVQAGRVSFILAEKIGHAVITRGVDLGEVEKLLDRHLTAHPVG